MKYLWNAINKLGIRRKAKNTLFIWSVITIGILLGTLAWITVGRLYLPGFEWLFCFMGYPAMILGYFAGVVYIYNHEFK